MVLAEAGGTVTGCPPKESESAAELVRLDPRFALVVGKAGPRRLRRRDPDGPFGALVRAITHQQLAGAAAVAIHTRLRALVPGPLTPEALMALPEGALRSAGLSAAKTVAILDLATKVASGVVPIHRLSRLGDDEIVRRLVQVRGIGRWTAEMFLIFQLRRPDVWPVDDLGVRHGFALVHDLPEAPPPRQLEILGEALRPLRSLAAWYCWEAVHLSRTGVDVSLRDP